MLTGGTRNLQLFLFVRGFPGMFIPPIHFLDMFVFGKVMREPGFIPQWHIVRDIWTETADGIDV
jgi:hypothetical protein